MARDVVRHMVEWMPGVVLGAAGIDVPAGPSVDDDPVGAWLTLSDTIQAALDDPEMAKKDLETRAGPCTLESGIDTFYVGDVLVHTWDLARATGQDETLDGDALSKAQDVLTTVDDAIRRPGGFAPKIVSAANADDQTRVLKC